MSPKYTLCGRLAIMYANMQCAVYGFLASYLLLHLASDQSHCTPLWLEGLPLTSQACLLLSPFLGITGKFQNKMGDISDIVTATKALVMNDQW